MAERGDWKNETWIIRHEGARLEVAARGATVVSWRVATPAGPRELIDGYRDDAELEAGHGARSAVMAPWSNRIHDACYTFADQHYDLGPAADGSREAIHGLVSDQDFTLTEATDNSLTLATSVAPQAGYPFPVTVAVTYRLAVGPRGGQRLEAHLVTTNVGTRRAPVGIGWHPYVQLGNVDELRVAIPARARVAVDDALIPLLGDDAYVPTALPVELAPIGEAIIDTAYTDLVADADGLVRSLLVGPDGASVTLEQRTATQRRGQGIVHIFTGDTLQVRRRQSLAIEPCQFVTNAFNRAETGRAVALAPGHSAVLDAALVYRGA
ncbi:aldose 1-epimerase [Buchananella hordeovulneris]|uniref:Aldose 1-epimerase n=1 Tax=Buchananella hordeovulneris TaxID=52770 RepID=A0A1Q5PWK4_9ACTO|nr:hypothetical protein [Buchananella hordeovulneris]OKL52003.1 hypothetical protein BSZ40_03480 [Buchananella hordeovulneris]